MPFSDGARNCVGQSLAKMEAMAFLAKLLGSFQLDLAPEVSDDPDSVGGVSAADN